MTSAQPQEVAVELYNQLARLPYAERERVGQIAWRLKALRQRHRFDPKIDIAYLVALQMLGDAPAADEIIEQLWTRRQSFEPDQLITFGSTLIDAGHFERTAEIVRHLARIVGARALGVARLFTCWLGSGDTRFLADFRPALDTFFAAVGYFALIESLTDKGLLSHFANHQSLVHEKLRGRMTGYRGVVYTAEGPPELVSEFYVLGSRAERLSIERDIETAVADYYVRNGFDPAVYVGNLTAIILPIQSLAPGHP